MTPFVPGMTLCEGFFRECAAPILAAHFPALRYSAGLIGYGSDVIGCDDAVSADHMWGPRFYLFLDAADMPKKEAIFRALSEHLPCTYRGYSVNYTAPALADNGVQHPEFVEHGPVHPLVFIETFDDYLRGQLGAADPAAMTPAEWLAGTPLEAVPLLGALINAAGCRMCRTIRRITQESRGFIVNISV